jgi:hypothetical protein
MEGFWDAHFLSFYNQSSHLPLKQTHAKSGIHVFNLSFFFFKHISQIFVLLSGSGVKNLLGE